MVASLPAVVVSVLLAVTTRVPVEPVERFDHSPFDAVLAEVVSGESVDYAKLRELHRNALRSYLDRLAEIDPAGMDDHERLALYLNLYNASMLAAVVDRYTPGYSPADDDFAVFDEPRVRLAGRRVTLNDLEHRLIRREFDDPRIHAALVCAARSCPPLANRAYRGEDLDEMLDRRMRSFVNDSDRNRIDAAGKTLRLSSVFDWYADDFGGRDRLSAYVDRFTEVDVSGFDVEFLPYSWGLNDVGR
ncbi:MAG TPA: DUF547 domain-containing protein [Candidatus Polarisedimenticolaceae bacterium]|nr:DUF547 domain-containing protein [Candidatus Polarisedimenticolaceae bacterium]